MPIIHLIFPNPLNTSVQKGDTAYFSNPVDVGPAKVYTSTQTPHKTNTQAEIIKIGEIMDLASTANPPVLLNFIQCNMPQDLYNQYYCEVPGCACPGGSRGAGCLDKGSFIMFSKDNKANMSSILGYYASAQFRNNSFDEAELFSVGVDTFESSK